MRQLIGASELPNADSFPSATLAADLIPKGWKIIEDVAPSKFKISDLKLAPFMEEGEDYGYGKPVREYSVGFKDNLGLVDAKFILEHQQEIPAEFQNNYLVFSGTVLRNPDDGSRRVACLCWIEESLGWSLYWCWLWLDCFWVDSPWVDGDERLSTAASPVRSLTLGGSF